MRTFLVNLPPLMLRPCIESASFRLVGIPRYLPRNRVRTFTLAQYVQVYTENLWLEYVDRNFITMQICRSLLPTGNDKSACVGQRGPIPGPWGDVIPRINRAFLPDASATKCALKHSITGQINVRESTTAAALGNKGGLRRKRGVT